MVPKRLFTEINFSGNGNYTFFISGEIGLCVNQGTGFLAETGHVQSISLGSIMYLLKLIILSYYYILLNYCIWKY
jgi:hypothetical protein